MSSPATLPANLLPTETALSKIGVNSAEIAKRLISDVHDNRIDSPFIRNIAQQAALQDDEFERLLLWRAAQESLEIVTSVAVTESVRERLIRELRQIHLATTSLQAGSYAFERAAKIVTLRRFPAGPMEWEYSGLPRSYLLQARFPANLHLLAFAMFRLKGLSPCFFIHIAPAPRNRALSIPKEVFRSYHRMASSLRLQPKMRGLIGHAWFHDPAAVRDNPYLRILSIPFLEHGGIITPLAPAPPSSGVMEGNSRRSAEYASGKLRYRYGLAVWPRDAAVQWADSHPEFGD